MSKCSVCGEFGHNRRRHDRAPIDVPGVGLQQADLLGALQGSVDRARAALAEARDRKATGDDAPTTATGPEPSPWVWDGTELVDTPQASEPAPSGLDEFRARAADAPDGTHPLPGEPNPIVLTGHDPASGLPLTNVADYIVERVVDQEFRGKTPTQVADQFTGLLPYLSGPASVDPGEHDCEPAPDQVFFCRHCGADLTPLPNPVPTWAPWRTELGPDGPLKICLPGVYDLPADVYHDPQVTGEWLSNSDARQLIAPGCPAKYRYNRDHGIRKESDAFDLGHAVHTRVLGKGEQIVARPDEWDSWRTKASQQWKAEQRAAGRTVILPEQLAVVEAMAASVWANEEARALLTQAGQAEACMFWIDEETGVQRRAMVDYLAGQPVDLKTAQSACPGFEMDAKIYKFAYHRQAATILDGIEALNLPYHGEFNLIYVETEAPYVPQVVKLDDIAQTVGRNENRSAIELYARCLETNTWPGYADGPVYASVPGYIARDHIEEMEIG